MPQGFCRPNQRIISMENYYYIIHILIASLTKYTPQIQSNNRSQCVKTPVPESTYLANMLLRCVNTSSRVTYLIRKCAVTVQSKFKYPSLVRCVSALISLLSDPLHVKSQYFTSVILIPSSASLPMKQYTHLQTHIGT